MANKKKGLNKAVTGIATVAVTALLASGVTYLAVKNGDSESTNLVTLKGDTITVSDFFKSVKNTSSAQQSMLTLVLTRVFEQQYGDKVSDKEVTDAYNKTASSYGSSFSSALTQAGLTTESYKQQIRTTKLVEYAVEQAAKKELTTKNYKAAYETYNPEAKALVIKLSDEETAKTVLESVKAEGADFESIAKEKTTEADKKVSYTFDSADTTLPSDVMSAAFKLDKDGISDVISVLDSSTYTYSYYIVKTTEKTEKDSDWKTYKKRLKKLLMAKYQSDTSFQNKVIAAALEKANVKIKDSAFADILSQYATSSSSSSSSSSTSSSTTESTTESSSDK
ncbi:MAG: peptidylprolyl isomerase PrsA [Streptococcus orisratti]|uniref:peptidylprolyl isomerase PrsA n=1 Tax=Streptococcus orisratti TaxID=114652 RepID=UPI0023558BFE|nr:peptidylprolyl isomerase PrsA [Streptococcus orisratti]MCI7677980.1 peptidylprolyl isomerase PrsA [Streptococcus orisratti]